MQLSFDSRLPFVRRPPKDLHLPSCISRSATQQHMICKNIRKPPG
ncbi:hypothetical protein CGRA01v4_11000 [Colletotrichum graminicola]|nr:hypothetical protein CGRA01v4_11000 [Colletotrichum graminicola]